MIKDEFYKHELCQPYVMSTNHNKNGYIQRLAY